MKLSVIIARRTVPPAFRLTIGGVVGFETSVDDPAEILVDGHALAWGEVAVRDGRYGVRVTQRLEGRHPAAGPGTLEVVLAEREGGPELIEAIAPGAIVEFDQRQHDTVELRRDGRPAARGYITPLADRVGIKVVELIIT